MKIYHTLDPLEDFSRTDYTNIEHNFLNPIRRSPPTAHNSPTTYGNCMKKTKNTKFNGKHLDKSRTDSNQTSLCNLERLYIANANKRKILKKEMNWLHSALITLGNIFSLFLITFTLFILFCCITAFSIVYIFLF